MTPNRQERRVLIEIDLSDLYAGLDAEALNLFRKESTKLAAKANQLFPQSVKTKREKSGIEQFKPSSKSDLGTIGTIMIVAAITARNVAPLISSIADLIRAISDMKCSSRHELTTTEQKRFSATQMELNNTAFRDSKNLVSFIETDLSKHAADTDPVFQTKEIKYNMRVLK